MSCPDVGGVMWIVVCYDVNTETREGRKRLRRVAQVCKNYGQRVQKSVFECQVDEMKYEQMRKRLLKEIRLELDNLRMYRLSEPREKRVEEYGSTRTVFYDEDTLVV
jgi:CRISPR-associated protein Cas2